MGYLVHKTSVDERKIEKLKANLHMIGDVLPSRHRIFVDSEDKLKTFDLAQHLDTAPELVHRAFNRPTNSMLQTGRVILNNASEKTITQVERLKERSYHELNQRIRRGEKLKKTVQTLQLQRNLMGGGSKRKIEDGSGGVPVFKWKRERSR